MLKSRFAIAFALATSAVLATAPAATAAAYPEFPINKVDLQYGNTYVTGTVTFYNRSVGVNGTAHYVGCRTVYATAIDILPDENHTELRLDIGSSSPRCDGDFPITIPLDANIPGGADRVRLELRDGNGNSFTPPKTVVYVVRLPNASR